MYISRTEFHITARPRLFRFSPYKFIKCIRLVTFYQNLRRVFSQKRHPLTFLYLFGQLTTFYRTSAICHAKESQTHSKEVTLGNIYQFSTKANHPCKLRESLDPPGQAPKNSSLFCLTPPPHALSPIFPDPIFACWYV